MTKKVGFFDVNTSSKIPKTKDPGRDLDSIITQQVSGYRDRTISDYTIIWKSLEPS